MWLKESYLKHFKKFWYLFSIEHVKRNYAIIEKIIKKIKADSVVDNRKMENS